MKKTDIHHNECKVKITLAKNNTPIWILKCYTIYNISKSIWGYYFLPKTDYSTGVWLIALNVKYIINA